MNKIIGIFVMIFGLMIFFIALFNSNNINGFMVIIYPLSFVLTFAGYGYIGKGIKGSIVAASFIIIFIISIISFGYIFKYLGINQSAFIIILASNITTLILTIFITKIIFPYDDFKEILSDIFFGIFRRNNNDY